MPQHALFRNGRLDDFLRKRHAEAKEAARKLPESQLRTLGVETAAAELAAKYRIQEIVLRPADRTMDDPIEVDVDVRNHQSFSRPQRGSPAMASGMRYVIHLPFDGDAVLFNLAPNMQTSMYPHADVKMSLGHLDIVAEVPSVDDPVVALKRKYDSELALLTSYSSAQVPQISEFNDKLLVEARQLLQDRLRLLDATKTAVTAIGIPLVTNAGAPTLPIALERRIEVHGAPLAPSESTTAPDRTISNADYEDILSLIRHQCRTFEGAPEAFAVLDEEHLRDVIRACLNAVYRGAATAEAFRTKGKTDICIEADDRSAFVAECKIWSGGKALSDALDQLLGYMTWRDCKASVLVFSKDIQKFLELVRKRVLPSIESHSGYVRTLSSDPETGEWRVVLRHSAGHDVTCHVMVYNLHVP